MGYIPDLSPVGPLPLLAVAYLDKEHPFPTGPVPAEFLERLEFLVNHPAISYLGFHTCELCASAYSASELFVPSADGAVYQAPDMIGHYIVDHGYRPPQQFIDAVLALPLRDGEPLLLRYARELPKYLKRFLVGQPNTRLAAQALSPHLLAAATKSATIFADPRWDADAAEQPIADLLEDAKFGSPKAEAVLAALNDPQHSRAAAPRGIPDLSPAGGAQAVGYDTALPTGALPPDALGWLQTLAARAAPLHTVLAPCPHCAEPVPLTEWTIDHRQARYRFSTLTLHLITGHAYLPPEAFVQAVEAAIGEQRREQAQQKWRAERDARRAAVAAQLSRPDSAPFRGEAQQRLPHLRNDPRWSEALADTSVALLLSSAEFGDKAASDMVDLLCDPQYRIPSEPIAPLAPPAHPDLAPLQHPRPLAVGYAAAVSPQADGSVSAETLARLEALCAPPAIAGAAAWRCPDCGETAEGGEIVVADPDGYLYQATTLIVHGIRAHGYVPPRRFLAAVEAIPTAQGAPLLKPLYTRPAELLQRDRFERKAEMRLIGSHLSPRWIALRYKTPAIFADPNWSEACADEPLVALERKAALGNVSAICRLLANRSYNRDVAEPLAPDLTPLPDGALAVGYFATAEGMPTGAVPAQVTAFLRRLVDSPSHLTLGNRTCPCCGGFMRSSEWEIERGGRRYRFSSLLFHLISAHGYMPPTAFTAALHELIQSWEQAALRRQEALMPGGAQQRAAGHQSVEEHARKLSTAVFTDPRWSAELAGESLTGLKELAAFGHAGAQGVLKLLEAPRYR